MSTSFSPATIPPTNNALRIPSIVNPETQQVVTRGRVRSPADLTSAWESLWWADLDSAQARTAAQQWRDGMSPYSVRRESLMGNAGRTNVNWGIGDQIAQDAEMPYNDLLDGVDTLFSMPTNWGTPYNKPLFISETGAGALSGFHADSLTRWSEEYQEWYYREQVDMLKRMPENFIGISPWVLADFRSPKRNNPVYQEGWNRKGLFSNEGKKKKAFYVLKSYYDQMK